MVLKDNHMQVDAQPDVSVGIVSGSQIRFRLDAPYLVEGALAEGEQTVAFAEKSIHWKGKCYQELTFIPQQSDASFSLFDVTIGVNFHWERKETQTFLGRLKFIVNEDKVCAVNELPVESYLESVISSEMSATSSLELLKAHAVISRSWLLVQMQNRKDNHGKSKPMSSEMPTEGELIRWYDREDHTLFDVCADDHCQRYQGITKETSWENLRKPYLVALRDAPHNESLQLNIEADADRWIRSNPESFCNTHDVKVLSQVLNNYDQETSDFYRWRVEYTQEQLQMLITEKLEIDFGHIIDLIPVERGTSGRLSKLKIIGDRKTLVIGKELEIRRALSKTHLYSSAFVVDALDRNEQGIPQRFVLIGAGWGHGVGLCQIGAAVMGERGYNYNEILLHYYKGATIEQIYR